MISCQNKPKITTKEINTNTCSDTLKYTNLITESINLPALQQYYKVQDILNQTELVILNNNQYLNYVSEIYKFDRPIKLLHKTKVKKEGIKAYIEYKEISIENDTATVYYRYDVQGIGVKSSYFLKECKWYLIQSDLWEN